MSGIVGLLHLDGSPVDQALLHKLTVSMSQRGPDAQNTWRHNQVGLGHTLLITTDEARYEQQPMSYDNRLWITADARIDGRSELRRQLGLNHNHLSSLTDPDLILLAYDKWGEACIDYLIGDFAFAIWDARRKHLFCARDHFGVKPFYYAYLSNSFLFSNTLDCVRLHPAISHRLNETAIGDILLFGNNQDLTTTVFHYIHSLPPAHRLTISTTPVEPQRYWTLPTNDHINYKNPDDYVAHFHHLLGQAVGDRLRTDRVSILMSGGLDSTTIAATTKAISFQKNRSLDIQAHTLIYTTFIDEEYHFSKITAQYLDIPIYYKVIDHYPRYYGWDSPEWYAPQPVAHPLDGVIKERDRELLQHSRVVLTGTGGDHIQYPEPEYPLRLLFNLSVNKLLMGIWQYRSVHGHFPNTYLRTNFKRLFSKKKVSCPQLNWLNPAFVKRAHLLNRWNTHVRSREGLHPTHSQACFILQKPTWPALFMKADPGFYSVPLEKRHPFFDLRLVEYFLSIPPFPWCENKTLLRLALHDRLPDSVRLRPKTPLPISSSSLHKHQWEHMIPLIDTPELAVFAETKALQESLSHIEDLDLPRESKRLLGRIISLAYWLQKC